MNERTTTTAGPEASASRLSASSVPGRDLLGELRTTLERANELLRVVESSQQGAAVREAGSAEERIAELERDLATATAEVERKETLIAAYSEYTGLTAQEVHGDVPKISAAVVGVMEQGDLTLVHLNVGKDDAVKRGYEFLVYNGATLRGRARVDVVNAATSTAVMIDTVQGQKVAQGDRASTRL